MFHKVFLVSHNNYVNVVSTHQERPLAMALLVERVEECNGLDGFTETHLVGKDGVYALTPRVTQPVQTLQLIRMQQHAGRLYKVRLFVILLLQI